MRSLTSLRNLIVFWRLFSIPLHIYDIMKTIQYINQAEGGKFQIDFILNSIYALLIQ